LLVPAAISAKSAADRAKKFLNLAKKGHGVIELDSSKFDELTTAPRSYGSVVLLTALDSEFNCQPCREFDPEFRIVASSFFNTPNKDKLLFAVLDFKNGKDTFRKLQLTSAPTLHYYPPAKGSGSSAVKTYEFNRFGIDAGNLANVLQSWTGYPVPVKRPFNYLGLAVGIFLVLAVAAVIRVMISHFTQILTSRYLWAFISLTIILLMNSGYMWNHIRKPPYIMSNNNRVSYISQGFSQQLGLESQIVAVTYGILAFSTVSLAVSVPRIPNPTRQRAAVYIWMGCVFVVFSFLMQLFKLKNNGYPFKLLF